MIRLCKDCKHFRPARFYSHLWGLFKSPGYYEFAKCAANSSAAASAVNKYVTGFPIYPPKQDYCDLSRRAGPCEPDGKLWEPRSSNPHSP